MSDAHWIEIALYPEGECHLTLEGCGCCESDFNLKDIENKMDELETLERYLKEQLSLVDKAKQLVKEND